MSESKTARERETEGKRGRQSLQAGGGPLTCSDKHLLDPTAFQPLLNEADTQNQHSSSVCFSCLVKACCPSSSMLNRFRRACVCNQWCNVVCNICPIAQQVQYDQQHQNHRFDSKGAHIMTKNVYLCYFG